MHRLPVLLLLISFSLPASAQLDRYIVSFTDKGSNPYSLSAPHEYLSQRAIERRQRYQIPIDSFDLPVTPRYIDSVRLSGTVSILPASKWLNQIAIRTTDATALAKILSYPFVQDVTAIASRQPLPGNFYNKWEQINTLPMQRTLQTNADTLHYGYSNGQVKMHNTDFLHRLGFTGGGIQMAVLDAGFFQYLNLAAFDSMRLNNQVLGTWDFVEGNESVNEDHLHGTQCLSVISANLPGEFVGMAPHTQFYLYRTEDVSSEYPIEEHFLAAGYEKADSTGADITSTSLGYTLFTDAQFNYTYNMMDGNTTMGARAADIGASRGMMMVVAAGNEGSNLWHYISTPADADSVIAVAAVDTVGNVGPFSSYGPSADGDIKPTLAAAGWNAIVINPYSGLPMYSSGTSFAAPNLAGLSSCLWQAFPEHSNMKIFDALIRSAHQYDQPDVRVGYGIPDVKKAFTQLVQEGAEASLTEPGCSPAMRLHVKQGEGMDVWLERKTPAEDSFQVVRTFVGTGEFSFRQLDHTDQIPADVEGLVQYRWGMTIGADTTFFIDSIGHLQSTDCLIVPPDTDSAYIYPNPAKGFVNLVVESVSPSPLVVRVHNVLGQTVFNLQTHQVAGTVVHHLPLTLAPGYYIVTVTLNGNRLLRTPLLISGRW